MKPAGLVQERKREIKGKKTIVIHTYQWQARQFTNLCPIL